MVHTPAEMYTRAMQPEGAFGGPAFSSYNSPYPGRQQQQPWKGQWPQDMSIFPVQRGQWWQRAAMDQSQRDFMDLAPVMEHQVQIPSRQYSYTAPPPRAPMRPQRYDAARQQAPPRHPGFQQPGPPQARNQRPPNMQRKKSNQAPTNTGAPANKLVRREVGLLPEVAEHVTTLVIFNIPWFYKMDEILEAWPEDGRYDYLNVLYNFEARHNVGYGFINFTKNEYAVRFVERWHGRLLPKQKSGKTLQTVPANHQGLRENLARLSLDDLKQMASAGVSPIVILDGERVDPREASMRLGILPANKAERDSERDAAPVCKLGEALSFAGVAEPPSTPLPDLLDLDSDVLDLPMTVLQSAPRPSLHWL